MKGIWKGEFFWFIESDRFLLLLKNSFLVNCTTLMDSNLFFGIHHGIWDLLMFLNPQHWIFCHVELITAWLSIAFSFKASIISIAYCWPVCSFLFLTLYVYNFLHWGVIFGSVIIFFISTACVIPCPRVSRLSGVHISVEKRASHKVIIGLNPKMITTCCLRPLRHKSDCFHRCFETEQTYSYRYKLWKLYMVR